MARSNETQQFFDGRADVYYRANYEQPRNRHEITLWLRREACLALVPKVPSRVLDLGCGPGAMTMPLLAAGHDVVACDLSVKMASDAARRIASAGGKPAVVAADATALPFRDHSFDVVVTTGVLEYVDALDLALAEVRRILRPGGLLVGTMSLPRRFERAVVRIYSELCRRPPGARQFIRARGSFDDLIECAGFSIRARTCCSFAPFPLDALWPRSVLLLDRWLGGTLNRSEVARDLAKTYVVSAIAP